MIGDPSRTVIGRGSTVSSSPNQHSIGAGGTPRDLFRMVRKITSSTFHSPLHGGVRIENHIAMRTSTANTSIGDISNVG